MFRCMGWALAAGVCLAWGSFGRAEVEPAKEATAAAAQAATAAANAEEIAKLVKQLDSDQFAQRQAATEKLAAIGKPAIEAVAKAATGESLEVTNRALDVLKKLYKSEDEGTKTAAKAALEKLAAGDHPPSARRAKDALRVAEPIAEDANGGIIIGGAPGIIQGRVQIQAIAGGGGKRVSIKNTNGVKEIDAEEDGKKVKIVDDPKQGIKMEITTKKDGKETTEKIEAKDAEDLKKKNKEAYETYKQYAENQGAANFQIQIGGGNVPIPALPAVPVPGNIRIGRAQRNQINVAAALLRSLAQQVQRMTGDDDLKNASKDQIEELKKQVEEVGKQMADLEKRIKEHGAKAAEPSADEKKPADKPADKPLDKPEPEQKPADPNRPVETPKATTKIAL